MKKKLMVGALSAAVLLVWGLIGFRVWGILKPHEEQRSYDLNVNTLPARPIVRDTLLLNYRDPFLDKVMKMEKTNVLPVRVTTHKRPAPQMSYKGMMRGRDGKRKALIQVGSELESIAVGESVEGARVIAMDSECVTVRWEGETLKFNIQ